MVSAAKTEVDKALICVVDIPEMCEAFKAAISLALSVIAAISVVVQAETGFVAAGTDAKLIDA